MSRLVYLFLFVTLTRVHFAQALCGDGVLDMGELCDTALSACCAPGCMSILPGGTVCRPAIGGCDVEEVCTGMSAECPPDEYRNFGYECRPIAMGSLCDVPEFCTGMSPYCPIDLAAPNTTLCREPGPGLECVLPQYCPGTLPSEDPNAKACPMDVAAPNTTVCRSTCNQCDVPEYCPGPGAVGEFMCGIDYNLATTPDPNYNNFNECTLDGSKCQQHTCTTSGICQPQGQGCLINIGSSTTCPQICALLYDESPFLDTYEWNRCVQEYIVDYNGGGGGSSSADVPGDPGFTDVVFSNRIQGSSCTLTILGTGMNTATCRDPFPYADDIGENFSTLGENCYIDGAHWVDYDTAVSMGDEPGLWVFTPEANALIAGTDLATQQYVVADLLSANPLNTCQACDNGGNNWRVKPDGSYCILPEELRYENNLCGNQALGVLGVCSSGQCIPTLETNSTNWGQVCRPAIGPCDEIEYCSINGTSPYCPPDVYKDIYGFWDYQVVDEDTIPSSISFGGHNAITNLNGYPAIAYTNYTDFPTFDDVYFAVNSEPDGSGVWTKSLVVSEWSGDGRRMDMAVIGGYPAIAFFQTENTEEMKFAINTETDGSGTWQVDQVTGGAIQGGWLSLAEVDGKPAIAYQSVLSIMVDSLKYTINDLPDGSGTWNVYIIDPQAQFLSYAGAGVKMTLIDGRPAVSYGARVSIFLPNFEIRYAISNNNDGTAGWTFVTVSSAEQASMFGTSMTVWGGFPVILYIRNEGNPTVLQYYELAFNNQTDGLGTWTTQILSGLPYTETTAEFGLKGCRLLTWYGLPLIISQVGETVYYSINDQEDGRGIWSHYTDNQVNRGFLDATVIEGRPAISYYTCVGGGCTEDTSTIDTTVRQLRFGYHTPEFDFCRMAEGECDVAEVCTGKSPYCPPNEVVPAGQSVVGMVRGPCEMIATCDGQNATAGINGTIPKGPMYMCRSAAGPCDLPEFCPDPELVTEWWLCPEDQLQPDTHICRAPTDLCDAPEFCSGNSTQCDAPDLLLPANTTCRSPVGLCDIEEVCDGISASCPMDEYEAQGFECRAIMGPCDLAEQCNGTSPLCPTDTFVQEGTVCLSSRGPCEDDHTCSGVSAECPEPTPYNSTVECRMSEGVCDLADFCPGNSYNCSADAKLAQGTVCRAVLDLCDLAEICDGVSNDCPQDTIHSAGFVCRQARGPCEIPQQCDGVSIFCPAEQFYDGQVTCRTAVGLCDVPEVCDPFANEPWLCPTDAFAPGGSICATSQGLCSENGLCTGTSGTCPGVTIFNSTVECRPAQTQCDQADFCDGMSEVCPETYLSAGTPCVANPLNCTVDECNGSGTCEVVMDNCDCMADIECALNTTATCFAATCVDGFCVEELAPGFCYIDGTCYGDQVQNPMNPCLLCDAQSMDRLDWSFSPSGTSCNTGNATGLCSAQDTCDGMGVCVDNFLSAGTTCRQSASLCDAEEQCTGSSDFCPMDIFAPQGTLCRNATGACDIPEYCDNMGQCPSDGVEYPGAICLPARGDCEEDGVCDGVDKECGARLLLPSGTQCRPSTLPCDVAEQCDGQNFDCPADLVQPSSHVCRLASGPCDQPETCDGLSKLCPSDQLFGPSHLCRMASGSCEEDGFCTLGTDQCEPISYKPMGTVCQSSSSLCAQDATCDGMSGTCPALSPLANGTQCFTPRGPCEGPGFCDGVTLECQLEGQKPDGTVCRVSTDAVCDPEETCNSQLPQPWLCPSDYKQPDGFPCPDSIFCNGDESCQAGICTMGATRDCDDGSPCTVDTCNEMSAVCVHTPLSVIGTVCYDGPMGTADVGVCRSGTIQCYGNGTLYCANQVLPGPMEICGDGLDNDCDGAPDNGCAGVTCVDDGDCIPFIPSACQGATCNTQTNFCHYPIVFGQCLIDGQMCVSDGSVDPMNPCQSCQSMVDQTAYSPDNSQNPSDGNICNGVEVCQGGQIVLSQPPLICPVSNNTCTPYICDSSLGCIQGPLPEGSECSLPFPYACDMGISVCDIQNQCICETGNLIDVRDRPMDDDDGPTDFPTLAIVLLSVFGGLLVLLVILLFLISFLNRRRRRRKSQRQRQ